VDFGSRRIGSDETTRPFEQSAREPSERRKGGSRALMYALLILVLIAGAVLRRLARVGQNQERRI